MVSVSRCVRKRAAEGGGASKILYGDPSISSSTKIHLHLQNTSRGSRFAADFALEGARFEPSVPPQKRTVAEATRRSLQAVTTVSTLVEAGIDRNLASLRSLGKPKLQEFRAGSDTSVLNKS